MLVIVVSARKELLSKLYRNKFSFSCIQILSFFNNKFLLVIGVQIISVYDICCNMLMLLISDITYKGICLTYHNSIKFIIKILFLLNPSSL